MPTPQDKKIAKCIGKKLKQLRGKKSAAKVAEEIGITQQQLSRYELGINKMSPGLLYRMASHFDVPVSTLYENYVDEGVVKRRTAKGDKKGLAPLDTDQQQLAILAKNWHRLKDDQKAIILKILDSYLPK